MIRTIKEWKEHKMKSSAINENDINRPDHDINIVKTIENPDDATQKDPGHESEINSVIDHAIALELSKEDTIRIIQNVFVDPAQAPDNISVVFVLDNMGEIVQRLEEMPEEYFSSQDENRFTVDMIGNDLPFECVMYAPNNSKLEQLSNVLNEQIKKDGFKSVYENGIFFVNSLDKMNEGNRSKVMNILREANAKNVGEKIKWKRKISK
jgi:hypothetical protein